jgi:hypothetical protein
MSDPPRFFQRLADALLVVTVNTESPELAMEADPFSHTFQDFFVQHTITVRDPIEFVVCMFSLFFFCHPHHRCPHSKAIILAGLSALLVCTECTCARWMVAAVAAAVKPFVCDIPTKTHKHTHVPDPWVAALVAHTIMS